MTTHQGTFLRNRIAVVAVALGLLYCVGYGMKVAGWRLVENNGGNAGPFPAFFPPQHVVVSSVATAACAVTARLLVRQSASPR